MTLDVQNFGLGMLAGWGSAYVLYRARHGISRVIGSARGSAAQAGVNATQSADRRYVHDLISRINSSGLLGPHVPLTQALIEPRFIPERRMPSATDSSESSDLYAILPFVHDLPWLTAPYHVETLTIAELAGGSQALALLGLPGSGRTTALMAIALHALGHLDLPRTPDVIQARLDREEAALTEKERAVRVNERIVTEQRARERLASERAGLSPHETEAAPAPATGGRASFAGYVPVYAHLAEVLADTTGFSAGADPAEPLVRAVQGTVGRVTSSMLPRELYRWLGKGRVLALIDGYDELPATDQGRARSWLAAFRQQYPDCFLIVAGGVYGPGPLLDLGFTPIYLRPWSDGDVQTAIGRLAALPPARGDKPVAPPDAAVRQIAAANTRAWSAAEVTLKIAANLGGPVEAGGVEGWIRAALVRLLPPGFPPDELTKRLGQLAALQLDEGVITPARVLELNAATQLVVPEPAMFLSDRPEEKAAADTKPANDATRLLSALERSGLLVDRLGDRYQFRHPIYAAWFASLYLAAADADIRRPRLDQPQWALAFTCLAAHSPVDDLVRAQLAAPADILHRRVFETARWMAFAPPDAAWRGSLLRVLHNWFSAASQYPLVRERAAAALVATREAGTAVIFRQGARSSQPAVRRLACFGLGAVAGTDSVRDLRSLLDDREPDVALAAAMALGAAGGEDALEALLIGLTTSSETIRQAVAEALAALPDDGYPVLFEAIEDEDMLLRRAAVAGLRRVPATWAIIAIYRAFLEDEQWYVRSAAQQAFEEFQYGRKVSLTAPAPMPSDLDWLTLWAAHRGEAVPAGPAGEQTLLRVLNEGDTHEKTLAAATLGQLGAAGSLKPLYAALRDRHEQVRAAAYTALGELQQRSAAVLPAP